MKETNIYGVLECEAIIIQSTSSQFLVFTYVVLEFGAIIIQSVPCLFLSTSLLIYSS